jgi:ribonuclease HI
VTHAASSELPPKLAALVQKGWRFSKKAPTALVVYTDGSGIGNGKKGAKAGLGVWWGNTGDALAL